MTFKPALTPEQRLEAREKLESRARTVAQLADEYGVSRLTIYRHCLPPERRGTRAPDLVGQRFGSLTVIERAPCPATVKKVRRAYWKCQCDCGGVRIVPTYKLNDGTAKQCKQCPPRHVNVSRETQGEPTMVRHRALSGNCPPTGNQRRILNGLLAASGPMTLAEMSAVCRVPKSTARTFVLQLVARRMVTVTKVREAANLPTVSHYYAFTDEGRERADVLLEAAR